MVCSRYDDRNGMCMLPALIRKKHVPTSLDHRHLNGIQVLLLHTNTVANSRGQSSKISIRQALTKSKVNYLWEHGVLLVSKHKLLVCFSITRTKSGKSNAAYFSSHRGVIYFTATQTSTFSYLSFTNCAEH